MQLSTYLQTLERVTPSRYSALLVYADDVREAAPLLARITGHSVSTMVAYLDRFKAGSNVHVDGIGRVATAAELRLGGEAFTKRLLHRVGSPQRTYPCTLVVAPDLTQDAVSTLRDRLAVGRDAECGVLLVGGKCPQAWRNGRNILHAASYGLELTVLEVPDAT